MNNKKLHVAKGAIVLASKSQVLLSPSAIDHLISDPEDDALTRSCHIYLIGKRPRISIVTDSLEMTAHGLQGSLEFQIQSKVEERMFLLERTTYPPEVKKFKVGAYPHNTLHLLDENGENIQSGLIGLFIPRMTGPFKELINLNVQYVGQAYGNSGSRHALQRLSNHATLQKICADIIANDPSSEIWLTLFEYDAPKILIEMTGKDNVKFSDDDERHFMNMMRAKLSKSICISMIEAGLIRYFQPQYNRVYKNSFPSSKHKHLKKAYELDFSKLVVEIDTEEIVLELYSDQIKSSIHHIAEFNLSNTKERKGFFLE